MQYRNLSYFHEVDRGGHFAAWEQPQLFTEELQAAFRPLRREASERRAVTSGADGPTGERGFSAFIREDPRKTDAERSAFADGPAP